MYITWAYFRNGHENIFCSMRPVSAPASKPWIINHIYIKKKKVFRVILILIEHTSFQIIDRSKDERKNKAALAVELRTDEQNQEILPHFIP